MKSMWESPVHKIAIISESKYVASLKIMRYLVHQKGVCLMWDKFLGRLNATEFFRNFGIKCLLLVHFKLCKFAHSNKDFHK